MRNYLKRRLPLLSFRNAAYQSMLASGFVLLFILVFKPFDYHLFSFREQLQLSLVIAIMVTISEIVLSGVFRIVFTRYSIDPKVWHHLLLGLIIVIICSQLLYGYTIFLTLNSFHLEGALVYLGSTAAIASFPVTATLFLRLKELQPGKKKLRIDIGSEIRYLPVEQVVLANAYDNYVKLVSINDENSPSVIVSRIPLYKIERRLGAYPNFFRCHRSFIVNLDLVERIEGNRSKYVIHLKGYDDPVPVARSKASRFQRLMAL